MNNKLLDYLYYFRNLIDLGLIIVKNDEDIVEIEKKVREYAISKVSNWKEILAVLKQNKPAYYILPDTLPKEEYDVLAQYADRGGMIQIMDRDTMDLITVHFDPTKGRLLLISSENHLNAVEKEYQILDKAGLMEVI